MWNIDCSDNDEGMSWQCDFCKCELLIVVIMMNEWAGKAMFKFQEACLTTGLKSQKSIFKI